MIVFVLCKVLPGYPDKEDASQEGPVWTADGAYIRSKCPVGNPDHSLLQRILECYKGDMFSLGKLAQIYFSGPQPALTAHSDFKSCLLGLM